MEAHKPSIISKYLWMDKWNQPNLLWQK